MPKWRNIRTKMRLKLSQFRLQRRGMTLGVAAAILAALAIWGSVAAFAAETPAAPPAQAPTQDPATQEPGAPPIVPPGFPVARPAPELPNINITGAWTRATPGNSTNAAVYLTIANTGTASDKIVTAESQIAEHTELHETAMSQGLASMHGMDSGVELAAGKTVSFEPNGRHIMLVGLKAPLKEGESFLVTFDFTTSGRQSFVVDVAGAAALGPPGTQSATAAKLLQSDATPPPSTVKPAGSTPAPN